MEPVITSILPDVVEVEEADKEQESSVANGDNNERHSTNIPHLAIKLEVSFPAKVLVTPLYNPGMQYHVSL